MKLIFVTGNKHKVEEMQAVLNDYDVELEQRPIDYLEDKAETVEDVVKRAARELADQLQAPVLVEDTGCFFNAYNNFPGAMPKFVIKSIGFEGIFRLLDGKDRSAYFKTAIGYCEPGGESQVFVAEMHGQVLTEPVVSDKEAMPYDFIFQPDEADRATVLLSMEEKNRISQRGKVAHMLGEFLKSKF